MRRILIVAAAVAGITQVKAQMVVQAKSVEKDKIIELPDSFYYQLDSVYKYVDDNSSWAIHSKEGYTYDNNKNLTRAHVQAMNGGRWENSLLTEYAYSADNSTLEKQAQIWDQPSSSWKNVWKKHFANDEANGQLDILYTEWVNNNWENIWQQKQMYDQSGLLIAYDTERWSENSDKWEAYWKYDCTYDAKGNVMGITNKSYDNTTNSWVNEWECLHDYSLTGELKSQHIIENDATSQEIENVRMTTVDNSVSDKRIEIREDWDTDLNAWAKSMRQTETFDANKNVVERRYEHWEANLNDWHLYRVDTYIYNTEGVKTEEATFYFDESTQVWNKHTKTVYYYTLLGDAGQDNKLNKPKNEVSVYPNPADAEIYLRYKGEAKQLNIYTITGKLVMQQDVPLVGQAVNVSKLRPGLYVVAVNFDEGESKVKFIKK